MYVNQAGREIRTIEIEENGIYKSGSQRQHGGASRDSEKINTEMEYRV